MTGLVKVFVVSAIKKHQLTSQKNMYILLPILAIFVSYGIIIYNKLVKYRIMAQEGYSGIDVQLKKRYDLIPYLLETVKGYAQHEKSTFDAVVTARNAAINAKNLSSQQQAEQQLNSSLVNLFALAEQYPDLKASENYKHLQQELSDIEDDIEKSRRYYNGTVREYNITVASFPSSIVANLFKFDAASFFELERSQREVPKINFGN